MRLGIQGLDGKRAFDLVIGTAALTASAPILLGIAVVMRGSGDRGPFFHRARRVGEGAKVITVFKIRTMDAGTSGPNLTAHDDPRVTRIGRMLRRRRIDELPQLLNVVRGDMSLVGPRPENPLFVDLADPLHRRVFMSKPGMTGASQLKYRDEALLLAGPDPETYYREVILPDKLRLDADYLEHRSLWLDLQILAKTVAAVLR